MDLYHFAVLVLQVTGLRDYSTANTCKFENARHCKNHVDTLAGYCTIGSKDPETNLATRGKGDGDFNQPCSIAFDLSGNIVVVDWGNDRIKSHR